MAKKPLQFQVSEDFRTELEELANRKDMSLSEFIRQSVRINMILTAYLSQGYRLVLKGGEEELEKELIFP